MKISYHNKKFRVVSNSENGELDANLVFHYRQVENVLMCEYAGGAVLAGHLLGRVGDDGAIDFSYHQLNQDGELKTGVGFSRPESLPNGKIRLHEEWEWTSGDRSRGASTLEEV